MTRTEEFEEVRPLLFSIAYRILGSVAEAEDAVQETWLRYENTSTRPVSANPDPRSDSWVEVQRGGKRNLSFRLFHQGMAMSRSG